MVPQPERFRPDITAVLFTNIASPSERSANGHCQWCAADNCARAGLIPSAPFHRTKLTLPLLICSLGFLSPLSCLTLQNVGQSVQHSLYQGEKMMAQRHQRGWLKTKRALSARPGYCSSLLLETAASRQPFTLRLFLVRPLFRGPDSECNYWLPMHRSSHQPRLKPKFEPACRFDLA